MDDKSIDWIYIILLAYLISQNAETHPQPAYRYADGETVCQDGIQTKFEGRCCVTCLPGEHMVIPCTVDNPNDTQCTPCEPNTYTDARNLLKTCFPHYRCGYGQKTERIGSAISNYICSCRTGFVETPDGGCRPDRKSQTITKRPVTSKSSLPEKPGRLVSTTQSINEVVTEVMKFVSGEADDGGNSKKRNKQPVNGEDNTSQVYEKEKPSSGNNSVVIIAVTCFPIACITIVIVVMVLRKKNEADTSRYKNPGGNDGNSDDTSSTTCDENCSSSACDSIAGDSNRRNPGSGASTTTLNSIDIDRSPQDSDAPAFGINDTIKPTSQTSLNFLGKVPYPGVLETGKAKSCTSLNDIRKHLPDDDNKYSQPSPDTPLLSSDSATVASH